MQRSKEILDELEQLSMVVAGISRQLPFEAPEGYFSEFPVKMLSQVAPAPAMDVPAGYFEGFASQMMARIKAMERPSADVPSVRPGQETAPQPATPGEQDEYSSLLDQIGKNMPYQLPQGYFETSIPSATLLGLKDKTVYEVPEGYFETLAEIVVARVQPAKAGAGKLVSMGRTRKTWLKYAAAAAVTGIILTVGWLRFQPSGKKSLPGGETAPVPQELARVSDQDLQSYIEDHTVQLQQVQQEEDYANSTASLDISDNDVKDLLGDVPDGDLKSYLEEHGDLKDYPTN